MGGDVEVVALISQHLGSACADVRYSAVKALAAVAVETDVQSMSKLITCLHDADDDVRYAAVKTLSRNPDERAVAALELCSNDSNDLVRATALRALRGSPVTDRNTYGVVHAESSRSFPIGESWGPWGQAQEQLRLWQL